MRITFASRIDVKIASSCRACVIKRTDIQKRPEFNELLGRICSLDAIRSRVLSLSPSLSLSLSPPSPFLSPFLFLSYSSLVPDVRNEAHLVARTRPMARRYGGCGHAQRPIASRVTQLSSWPLPLPIRTASRMTHSVRLANTPRRQSLLMRAWGVFLSRAAARETERPHWSAASRGLLLQTRFRSRSPNWITVERRIRCVWNRKWNWKWIRCGLLPESRGSS